MSHHQRPKSWLKGRDAGLEKKLKLFFFSNFDRKTLENFFMWQGEAKFDALNLKIHE